VNAERLNGLSLEALYALAEKMGLDLPHGLERIFVMEAVLEAFIEDSADRRASPDAAVHVEEKKYSGSDLDEIDASLDAAPCIANRYNETVIHLMARDPEWAFAFWDVKLEEQDGMCDGEGFSGFYLRVVMDPGQSSKPSSFDVPVGEDDDHWYLHLPGQDAPYRVDLCVRCGSRHRVLARSNAIMTPRALSAEAYADLPERSAELLRLSGLERLDGSRPSGRHPSRIMADSLE